MKKINEIFYSLQGEGFYAGTPAVFIRFSGCNLKCDFCDTDHAEGSEMTDDEIIAEVVKYPCEWIILTGGEPSLRIDGKFIEKLKTLTGKKIAIETNGSRKLPANIDWITVSPKNNIGGIPDYDIQVERADEIKVVDVGQYLDWYFNMPCRMPDTRMSLQPCFNPNKEIFKENIQRTVTRVLSDPRWTLSFQLHRILGIP